MFDCYFKILLFFYLLIVKYRRKALLFIILHCCNFLPTSQNFKWLFNLKVDIGFLKDNNFAVHKMKKNLTI